MVWTRKSCLTQFREVLRASATCAAVLLCLTGSASADVSVFAAASLKTVLDEIARDFEAAHGEAVNVTVAGSSMLARQIDFGAPADVFVSANVDWMDFLEERERLVAQSRRSVAGNDLVLIQPKGQAGTSAEDFETTLARLQGHRVAMALVDAVPAGIYGKSALQSLGHWEQVGSNVVQTDNVRAALALVALGEVPFGVVYKSDALADQRVEIIGVFPAGSHDEIVYPAAVLRGSEGTGAQAFLDFLSGEVARSALSSHGFRTISP